jgi:uridylate kinase
MQKSIVVKIGGSLIYDMDLNINARFLSKVLTWYEGAKREYDRIVLVVGGGKMSRHVTDQVRDIVPDAIGLHRIGMATTLVNSEILHAIMQDGDIYIPRTIGDALEFLVSNDGKTMVTGGYKVGWSTDMDAAVFADILGIDKVYKLSNIENVYTADPKVNLDAKPVMDMTWSDYMSQFHIRPGMTQHEPGVNAPVGAFCSQFCAQKGISFMVGGGKNLETDRSLQDVLESGSLIHP